MAATIPRGASAAGPRRLLRWVEARDPALAFLARFAIAGLRGMLASRFGVVVGLVAAAGVVGIGVGLWLAPGDWGGWLAALVGLAGIVGAYMAADRAARGGDRLAQPNLAKQVAALEARMLRLRAMIGDDGRPTITASSAGPSREEPELLALRSELENLRAIVEQWIEQSAAPVARNDALTAGARASLLPDDAALLRARMAPALPRRDARFETLAVELDNRQSDRLTQSLRAVEQRLAAAIDAAEARLKAQIDLLPEPRRRD